MTTSDKTSSSDGPRQQQNLARDFWDDLWEGIFPRAEIQQLLRESVEAGQREAAESARRAGQVSEKFRRLTPTFQRWLSGYTCRVVSDLRRLMGRPGFGTDLAAQAKALKAAIDLLVDYWKSMHKIYEERDAAIRERDAVRAEGKQIIERGKAIAARAEAIIADARRLQRELDKAVKGRAMEAESAKFWYNRWASASVRQHDDAAQEKRPPSDYRDGQSLARCGRPDVRSFTANGRCVLPVFHKGPCMFEVPVSTGFMAPRS